MRLYSVIAAAAAFVALAATSANAQDFQQSYTLRPGGSINIASLSGNIKITGGGGSAVVVTAIKRGADADKVEIEDRSSANAVDVSVRYPRECDCDATVDFEVQVPAGVAYRYDKIVSMSGNVEVSNVTGRISVKSMSGDVRVRDVSGTVEATAMSGNIHAEIARLEGDGSLEFTSMSGDVEVRLPGSLDADVQMNTLSGAISTDFPIQIEEKKYGPGQSAKGTLGSGSRSVRIKSLSGDARLLRN
jgi:DUF4097 and DUF4098 domain-containing protein YvlB